MQLSVFSDGFRRPMWKGHLTLKGVMAHRLRTIALDPLELIHHQQNSYCRQYFQWRLPMPSCSNDLSPLWRTLFLYNPSHDLFTPPHLQTFGPGRSPSKSWLLLLIGLNMRNSETELPEEQWQSNPVCKNSCKNGNFYILSASKFE